MASVNKVILVGNLGADPETRYLPNGDQVTTLRLATTDTWKDKDGNKQEATEWHRVVLWRKLAEIASQYLKKGAQIYIEGSLKTRKWQDKDGQDRYTTEITSDTMKMLGRKPEGNSSAPAPSRPAQGNASPPPAAGGGFQDFSDDIPFDRLGRGLAFHVL